MFLGQIYRTELAKKVKSVGYTIEKTSDKNTFEIKEVPKELIKTFSKRREEIKEKLKEYDYKNAKTSANATLMTRKNKQKIQTELLYNEWNKVVKTKNINLNNIVSTSYSKIQESKYIKINSIVRDTILHISERESAFTKAKIIQESLKMGFGHVSIIDVEKSISKLEKQNLLIKSNSSYLYTTAKAIKLEKEVISLMKQGQNTCKPILDSNKQLSLNSNNTEDKLTSLIIKDVLKQGFKLDERFKNKSLIYNTLNTSQKQSADFILSNKDRIIGIQGYAGTGKTYMINAVRELAEKNNIKLEGLAPTASATKTLGTNANIPSRTLHSFLFEYEGVAKGRGTKEGINSIKEKYKNTIFVMDESSLAGTQQMKDLLTIINRIDSRIVLVGDTKQLNSVEAGKPFYQLQEKGIAIFTMNEIRRQKKEYIKEAVYHSIKGNIKESFEKLKENIIEINSNNQNNKNININPIVQTAINKYLSLSQKERNNTLILTPANETRREINELIRQELIKESKLTDKTDNLLLKHINYKDINKTNKINVETLHNKGLTQTQKSKALFYAKDDVVLFNRTYKSLEIKKGEYYSVKSSNLNNNEIKLEKYIGLENEKNFKNKEINNKNNNAKLVAWNPDNIGGRRTGAIEVYTKESKELQKGDIIRHTKNDKQLGLINSKTSEITKIGISNIHFKDKETNKTYEIPKDHHSLKHIDYGYATTVHSAQGKTSNNVIAVIESYRKNLTNQKTFYVEVSRAKDNITLIVDNKEKVINQLNIISGEKVSGLEIKKDNDIKKDFSSLNNKTDKLLNVVFKDSYKNLNKSFEK